MTSEKLQRTSYRDPNTSDDRVRTGPASLPESGQDMEQYYQPLERIHGSNLHGWGVASGLEVSATLNSSSLTIQPGVALDNQGHHISLAVGSKAEVGQSPNGFSTAANFIPVTASGMVLPTTSITGDKYLTIQFWETFDSDDYNSSGDFRYWHTPWIRLLDTASFTNNGSQVVLAKVSFGTGASAGQVTALSQDLRQATTVPVAGSVYLQRQVQVPGSTANSIKVEAVDAAVLQAHNGGGLDLTVPNASDEIHLSRSDGGNFAKVSLGADHIVARQGNGQESVTIDTTSGSIIASGSITASGTITAGPHLRQNSLYLSGGPGWSSLSYNAYHDPNGSWVFPDTSHSAVTIEMDDNSGTPRFQVWSTTPGNPTSWQMRFSIDGNTGNVWSAGTTTASGEAVVKNAPGNDTIVLNGNAGTIEVGGAGTNGGITVYNTNHGGACIINGENGKITSTSIWTTKGGFFGDTVRVGGDLSINGSITKGGGSFRIDHPLDPEHKYLSHSFVESPDMKNVYDGIATLDANGEATVELAAWFSALNRDARYQLTCIGDYAPVYIARKIQDNCFTIAGGKPGMEVSWQVTGIRQDAWARAHPICPEQEKSPAEQGSYLHPEEHGVDASRGIHTAVSFAD